VGALRLRARRARGRQQAAKSEQSKEEVAGKCNARPVADDAGMRRFAAA